jgi:hypothetical protein
MGGVCHQQHTTAASQGFHSFLTAQRAQTHFHSDFSLRRIVVHIAANGTAIKTTVLELYN